MLASSPPAAKTGADRRSGGEGGGGGRGAGGGGGGGVGAGVGVGGGGGRGGLAARVRFSVGRERRIDGAEGRRTGGSSEARSSQRGVHRATVGQRAGTAGVAARGRGEAGGASGAESPACARSRGWLGRGWGWLVVDVGRLATAADRPAVRRPPAPRPSAATLPRFPPIARTAMRPRVYRCSLLPSSCFVLFFEG